MASRGSRDAPADFVVGPVMLPSASQVRPSAARASASGAMSRPEKKEQKTCCIQYLTGGMSTNIACSRRHHSKCYRHTTHGPSLSQQHQPHRHHHHHCRHRLVRRKLRTMVHPWCVFILLLSACRFTFLVEPLGCRHLCYYCCNGPRAIPHRRLLHEHSLGLNPRSPSNLPLVARLMPGSPLKPRSCPWRR